MLLTLGIFELTMGMVAAFEERRLRAAIPSDDLWIPRLKWLFSILGLILFATGGQMARKEWRQYRRRKLGLCLACGYDLRGSSNQCPECGRMENVDGNAS